MHTFARPMCAAFVVGIPRASLATVQRRARRAARFFAANRRPLSACAREDERTTTRHTCTHAIRSLSTRASMMTAYRCGAVVALTLLFAVAAACAAVGQFHSCRIPHAQRSCMHGAALVRCAVMHGHCALSSHRAVVSYRAGTMRSRRSRPLDAAQLTVPHSCSTILCAGPMQQPHHQRVYPSVACSHSRGVACRTIRHTRSPSINMTAIVPQLVAQARPATLHFVISWIASMLTRRSCRVQTSRSKRSMIRGRRAMDSSRSDNAARRRSEECEDETG
jgi:hypothetical protein